jgi:hypothetical protein
MTVGKLREILAGFEEDTPVLLNAKRSVGGDSWLELVPITGVLKPYDVVEFETSVLLEIP